MKTGARLPDGSAPTILGGYVDEAIGSGVTLIPLFAGFVLPPGPSADSYPIEAALLEPGLGMP